MEVVAPPQIVADVTVVPTDGNVLTVIVIALEVAGFPVTPAKFDVMTQVTIWPVVRLVVE